VRFIRLILTRLMRGMRSIATVCTAVFAASLVYRVISRDYVGEGLMIVIMLALTGALFFGAVSFVAFILARLVRPEEPGEI
jgi:hypothetical protein